MELHISPDHEYALVVIPPGVWHVPGVGEPVPSANCATEPSDPSELERLDADDPSIPYAWAVS